MFILLVGMSMAELASAAPTSGGVSALGSRVCEIFPNVALVVLLDPLSVFPTLAKSPGMDRWLCVHAVASLDFEVTNPTFL